MDTGDDQAGDVGDVTDVISPDFLGDLAEDLEVDGPGVGRSPGDDDFGVMFLGQSRILS